MQEVDFTELKSEASTLNAAPAAATPKAVKAASKDKEDGKIEGAIQIGILYKKEVDFSGWYTDVRITFYLTMITFDIAPPGLTQGGYARLLQRQRLLYFKTLVLQYLGGDTRYVAITRVQNFGLIPVKNGLMLR